MLPSAPYINVCDRVDLRLRIVALARDQQAAKAQATIDVYRSGDYIKLSKSYDPDTGLAFAEATSGRVVELESQVDEIKEDVKESREQLDRMKQELQDYIMEISLLVLRVRASG
ncbi:hypothetical protein EK21DRAFT_89615 [Setomelanomma holmii]|uniref:Uncharacterized protein n=1 Tax=Setomelanomma holmii TaxID=210430 RepID=A0A9P4H8I1_9PLEO|nr:hypothetical protein EK21DRAFT_89615 [Setomelanomma holmii]